MGVFCRKHSTSEEPISVIAKILSNDDDTKFEEIFSNFKELEFFKVKDLAQATLAKASQMAILGEDPLDQLYDAIQKYDALCITRFDAAAQLYKTCHYKEALDCFEKYHAYQPAEINILLYLSACYFKLGDYEKSIECLNSASHNFHEDAEVLNNLGINFMQTGRFIEARDLFYKAISTDHEFIECWVNYVRTVIQLKDYTNAEKAITMVLGYDYDSLRARHIYGQLLLRLNRVDEAINQFKLALFKYPKSALTWTHLGNSYVIKNENDKAVICFEKAIENDENLIAPKINLGLTYLKLKEYTKSIEILRCAICLCPSNMNILKIIAHVYFSQNLKVSAVKAYNLYLKHIPNDPDIYFSLGILYFHKNRDSVAAEPCFQKCVDLDPNNVEYYRYLMLVYQDRKKNDLAFKTAIKMGDLYLEQNDITNAKRVFYYAIHFYPENYYIHWKLGQIFYMLEPHNRALLRSNDNAVS